MGSRVVWQTMSLILIIGGVFGKFGAALSIVPDPIIGNILKVIYFSPSVCISCHYKIITLYFAQNMKNVCL